METGYAPHQNTSTAPRIETVPGTIDMTGFEDVITTSAMEESFNPPAEIQDSPNPTPETIEQEPVILNNRTVRELGDKIVAGETVDPDLIVHVKNLLEQNAERDEAEQIRLNADGKIWRFRGEKGEDGKQGSLSQRSAHVVYEAGSVIEAQRKAAEEANQSADISAQALQEAAIKTDATAHGATLEEARAINSGTATVDQVIRERQKELIRKTEQDATSKQEEEKKSAEQKDRKAVQEDKKTSEKPKPSDALKPHAKVVAESINEGLKGKDTTLGAKSELNKAIGNLNPTEKEVLAYEIASDALSSELADIIKINPEDLTESAAEDLAKKLDEYLFEHTNTSFTIHSEINDIYIKAFSNVLSALKEPVKAAYLAKTRHPFFRMEHGPYPTTIDNWVGTALISESVTT